MMNKRFYFINRQAVSYLVIACVLTSCAGTAAYRAPVSRFQEASVVWRKHQIK
jgi:outer membrane biogenesis lipoprotein LolB